MAQTPRDQSAGARNRHRPGEHKCKTRVEMTGNVEKTAHPRGIEHARKRKAEAEDHAREERHENSRQNMDHGLVKLPSGSSRATVIIPKARKVATATIDLRESRARPQTP